MISEETVTDGDDVTQTVHNFRIGHYNGSRVAVKYLSVDHVSLTRTDLLELKTVSGTSGVARVPEWGGASTFAGKSLRRAKKVVKELVIRSFTYSLRLCFSIILKATNNINIGPTRCNLIRKNTN